MESIEKLNPDQWLIDAVRIAYPCFDAQKLVDRYWTNGTRAEQIQMLRIYDLYGNRETIVSRSPVAC